MRQTYDHIFIVFSPHQHDVFFFGNICIINDGQTFGGIFFVSLEERKLNDKIAKFKAGSYY